MNILTNCPNYNKQTAVPSYSVLTIWNKNGPHVIVESIGEIHEFPMANPFKAHAICPRWIA